MRRLYAGTLPFVLSVLLVGCSAIKKPPYCPVQPPAAQGSPSSAGGPLHQKALEYDSWAQSLQPPHYGGMVNTQFSGPPNQQQQGVEAYNDLQDSADWTGTYLAAEAFRYAVTGDPEAKENAKRAALTLDFFLKVTCSPGVLARYAGCLTKPAETYVGKCLETAKQPCYRISQPACETQADNRCEGHALFWLGNTSRDQYTGWFFGMGVAYRLIDDPELRQLIREDVKQMIDALHDWKFVIHGPDGKPNSSSSAHVEPLMQLSWLLIAADVLRDDPQYCQWYEETVKSKVGIGLVDNFSGLNRYFQYYGFNLAFLNNYNLILLEPNAERKKVYLDAFRDGAYHYVKGTGNTLFDYIYMATSGTPDPETLAGDRKSLEMFQNAPNVMQCIQPPPADLSRTSVVLYKINKLLSHLGLKQEVYPQAKDPYPLNEWCPVDYLWQQSPYSVCCFASCPQGSTQTASWPPAASQAHCDQTPFTPNVVYPGADYLLAYWMGRYHGFLMAED